MEEALARKQRLKAMKAKAEAAQAREGATQGDAPAPQEQAPPSSAAPAPANEPEPEVEKPVLKFRNYQLRDKTIPHEEVKPAQVKKPEMPVIVKRLEDAEQEEVLASVAPKKANWDLKREVAPKLEKLERRTQRALVEIMQEEERQRLEEEGGVQD